MHLLHCRRLSTFLVVIKPHQAEVVNLLQMLSDRLPFTVDAKATPQALVCFKIAKRFRLEFRDFQAHCRVYVNRLL